MLPSILLSFLAGSFSDRWDKKRIMLISDTVSALFSVIVFCLYVTSSLRIEYLYVINFVLGVTDSFQNPASEVAISLIVPKESYQRISGIRSFCNSFLTILSPVTASAIYVWGGLGTVLFLDFISFLFAFYTLARKVRIPKYENAVGNENGSLLANCKVGIEFILRRKGLSRLILFMWFVNLIAAIYNSILVPMILSRSGYNEMQQAIVTATIGVAGIVGSIVVIRWKGTSRRIPLILNIMSFSFLVCNCLLGLGRNYYIWTLAVFLGNSMVPLLMANVEYIMRTVTPISMQGRVFSARNTMQYISIPIGYLVGGILADKVFEPFMAKESSIQRIARALVGEGHGSGMALIYILIGLIGFLGCCLFRLSSNFRELDDEVKELK
jgi:MFS family permease